MHHKHWVGLVLLIACHKGGDGDAGIEIPELEAPTVTADEMVRDEAIGLMRSRSRLLVLMDVDASPRQVGAALAAAGDGAEIIGGFPELGLMLIRVGADLDDAREAVGRVDGVAAVEADYALSPDALFEPPDPSTGIPPSDHEGHHLDWAWEVQPAGSNWWLEAVRMPAAWSWNDAIEEAGGELVAVGVADTPAMADHLDLLGRVERLDTETPDEHGTSVCGVITARFDDQLGVNGTTPWAAVTHISLGGDVTALATLGDVILTWSRQLIRHSDIRVLNLSNGYNWFENQGPTRDAADLVTWAPRPVADRPDQQHVVEQQGLIAARHAEWLARQDPPVIVVASAGNDGLDPADISPTISPADRPDAEAWETPDARWNSPYCNAGITGALENVYCVESSARASDFSVTRAGFSSVGGTLSAPGEDVGGLLRACTSAGCSSTSDGYTHGDGTSYSAPLVTGILTQMLAFKPDATAQELRIAIMGNLVAAVGDGADGIDAFAAMMALDGAPAALMDVDDGTPQGLDVTLADDARGDGEVDMADFRRVRDALLWDLGDRAHLPAGPGDAKRDHNRDGVVDDLKPEVWSRFDFDGDAELTTADLTVLGGDAWEDADVAGNVIDQLLFSADLEIDAHLLWEAGLTEIELSASATPYTLRIVPGSPTHLFTVAAGAISLEGAVLAGAAGITVKPVALTLGNGEDRKVVLERDLPRAPGWVERPAQLIFQSCGTTEDAIGYVYNHTWFYTCPDMGTRRTRVVAEVPAWTYPSECDPDHPTWCRDGWEADAYTVDQTEGPTYWEEESWVQTQWGPPADPTLTNWVYYGSHGLGCFGPLVMAEAIAREDATVITCHAVP